jgi:hypothetical protein
MIGFYRTNGWTLVNPVVINFRMSYLYIQRAIPGNYGPKLLLFNSILKQTKRSIQNRGENHHALQLKLILKQNKERYVQNSNKFIFSNAVQLKEPCVICVIDSKQKR